MGEPVLITTSKGKVGICYNGYAYYQAEMPELGDDKYRYRCLLTNRCNGKLWSNINRDMVIERGGHSNDCIPDPEKIKALIMESNMKGAAVDTALPLPQLYRNHSKKTL